MDTDYKIVFRNKSTEELLKIVVENRVDYNFKAVEAAEDELKSRNIKFEKPITEEENNEIRKKQSTPIFVSTFSRFLNFFIDTSIILLFTILLLKIIDINGNVYEDGALNNYAFNFSYLCSFVLYYIIFESYNRKTIGKIVTNTEVIKKNGDKPTVSDIIVRTFGRFIPFDVLSYLFLDNGFHDIISNTMLIYSNQKS